LPNFLSWEFQRGGGLRGYLVPWCAQLVLNDLHGHCVVKAGDLVAQLLQLVHGGWRQYVWPDSQRLALQNEFKSTSANAAQLPVPTLTTGSQDVTYPQRIHGGGGGGSHMQPIQRQNLLLTSIADIQAEQWQWQAGGVVWCAIWCTFSTQTQQIGIEANTGEATSALISAVRM